MGNSPASEFYMPTFRNTLFHLLRQVSAEWLGWIYWGIYTEKDKVVLKPILSYGVQLWRCAKPSRLKTIQRFQSKLLITIANAPRYVSNQMIHNDLNISSITNEIQQEVTKYNTKTYTHANDLIEHLYNNGTSDRRLRRTWSADLVQHRNNIP